MNITSLGGVKLFSSFPKMQRKWEKPMKQSIGTVANLSYGSFPYLIEFEENPV